MFLFFSEDDVQKVVSFFVDFEAVECSAVHEICYFFIVFSEDDAEKVVSLLVDFKTDSILVDMGDVI